MLEHGRKAVAFAPDETSAVHMRTMTLTVATLQHPRQHTLAAFNPVAAFGEDGAFLRETVER